MPQVSNWTIPNSGGSTFRATLNTTLAALQSTSSGAAAPSPTVAGMLWYDTTNSILKRRNTANTAWVDVNSDTIPATTVRGNSSGSAAAETAISMASLRTMLGFSQSVAGNGYVALPGDVIVQWGTGTPPAGGTVAVTYPVAFTTVGRVAASPLSSGPRGVSLDTFTVSGFSANTFTTNTGTALALGFNWIAVGY